MQEQAGQTLRQVLVPRMEEVGELVDVHLKVREDFYEGRSPALPVA